MGSKNKREKKAEKLAVATAPISSALIGLIVVGLGWALWVTYRYLDAHAYAWRAFQILDIGVPTPTALLRDLHALLVWSIIFFGSAAWGLKITRRVAYPSALFKFVV
jgi:hypothetical protein